MLSPTKSGDFLLITVSTFCRFWKRFHNEWAAGARLRGLTLKVLKNCRMERRDRRVALIQEMKLDLDNSISRHQAHERFRLAGLGSKGAVIEKEIAQLEHSSVNSKAVADIST